MLVTKCSYLSKLILIFVPDIYTTGRFSISQEMSKQTVTNSTPLSMFLPATSGQGRCALALVNFLVTLHNNFIGRCKSLLNDERRFV